VRESRRRAAATFLSGGEVGARSQYSAAEHDVDGMDATSNPCGSSPGAHSHRSQLNALYQVAVRRGPSPLDHAPRRRRSKGRRTSNQVHRKEEL
jgi:hypothetical protein